MYFAFYGSNITSFAKAMEGVLNGEKWRRTDWNRPAYIEKRQVEFDSPTTIIVIVMNDGRINAYSPSQCDMTAFDWRRVR